MVVWTDDLEAVRSCHRPGRSRTQSKRCQRSAPPGPTIEWLGDSSLHPQGRHERGTYPPRRLRSSSQRSAQINRAASDCQRTTTSAIRPAATSTRYQGQTTLALSLLRSCSIRSPHRSRAADRVESTAAAPPRKACQRGSCHRGRTVRAAVRHNGGYTDPAVTPLVERFCSEVTRRTGCAWRRGLATPDRTNRRSGSSLRPGTNLTGIFRVQAPPCRAG